MAMHQLGFTTRPSANNPSYGLSARTPGKAAPSDRLKSERRRPDMYKLSATVKSKGSDEESLNQAAGFPKSSDWFNDSFSGPAQKEMRSTVTHVDDDESEKNMGSNHSRGSDEDHMQIMVSKSFQVIDEEYLAPQGHVHR